MVCIPCILAPILLWIWYRFLQPVMLKFWNPWAPKKPVEDSKVSEGSKEKIGEPKCPFSDGTSDEIISPSEKGDASDKKND